jgi:hypothetical protein
MTSAVSPPNMPQTTVSLTPHTWRDGCSRESMDMAAGSIRLSFPLPSATTKPHSEVAIRGCK